MPVSAAAVEGPG